VHLSVSMGIFDCEEVLLYVVREDTNSLHHLEIFDAKGESLATITNDPDRFLLTVKSQVKQNQLLGLAESPKRGSNLFKKGAKPPDPEKGGIRRWQLEVQGGLDHPLTQPEKQWVLGVAVQMHAIREASRGSDINGLQVPWQIHGLEVVAFILVIALCGLFHWSLWEVYRLVYPAQKRAPEETDNPYVLGMPPTAFLFDLKDPKLYLAQQKLAS